MKGEAQANAMSVCVCNKTKKIKHWTLVVCYLSCALMCYFSYALVCYLSCAVLAITGRTSTCRCRVDLIAHCRSALFLFFFTHRVRLHSTLGRSQGEGSQVWRIARGRSRTPRQQSRYESTCFALETRATTHKRRCQKLTAAFGAREAF